MVLVGRFIIPLRKNAKGAMMLGSGGFAGLRRPIEPAHGIAGVEAGIGFSIFREVKAYLIGEFIERRE